jgi:leader peptidase (prepilin peptidase)/N-methyltransferase
MSTLVLLAIVFISVLGLLVTVYQFLNRRQLATADAARTRLAMSASAGQAVTPLLKGEEIASELPLLNRLLTGREWTASIAQQLRAAGSDLNPGAFLLIVAVCGAAGLLLGRRLGGAGMVVGGVLAAAALDPLSPWTAMAAAGARAAGTAALLALLASGYRAVSGQDGLGRGDVKLAAAVGAWLPPEAIPTCFALAAGTALAFVLVARLRGRAVLRTTPIPLGTFLCPSLWLVFFAGVL